MILNEFHKAVMSVLTKHYTSTKTIASRVEVLNDHGVTKALSDLEREKIISRKTVFNKTTLNSQSRWKLN